MPGAPTPAARRHSPTAGCTSPGFTGQPRTRDSPAATRRQTRGAGEERGRHCGPAHSTGGVPASAARESKRGGGDAEKKGEGETGTYSLAVSGINNQSSKNEIVTIVAF